MAGTRRARSDTAFTRQGECVEEVRRNVLEAVNCYFDETMARPGLIRLHFVRDEILVA